MSRIDVKKLRRRYLAFSSASPRDRRPGCDRSWDAAVQMHVAGLADGGGAAPGVRLGCGFARYDEKNWIGFDRGGALHFVYSLAPHVVALARPADGACVARWSTSTFAPFRALVAGGAAALHGSATAVRRGGAYLALAHARDARGAYTTFFYEFAPNPPFAPVRVSRPLPLARARAAFASGLALDGRGAVVVTYGVANAQSRALVLGDADVDALFDWCADDDVNDDDDPGG